MTQRLKVFLNVLHFVIVIMLATTVGKVVEAARLLVVEFTSCAHPHLAALARRTLQTLSRGPAPTATMQGLSSGL